MSTPILVVDKQDDLHRALEHAAPGLKAEMTACHQTARAAEMLGAPQLRVLVAGPSCLTAAGLRFLQRAHQQRPDVTILLFKGRETPELPLRDVVRTGAADILNFPAPAKTLRAALEAARQTATGRAAAAEDDPSQGVAFTVTSPSGGCGKTFFATNLAYELVVRTGKRVALVDFDLQFGEVNTALHLRPEATVHDLVETACDDPELLRRHLPDFMERHRSGVDVLAAPADPAQADLIPAPTVAEIVQACKERYDYVVVDTPAALTEAVLATLDLSERLVVMATLDLPSVKNLGVFLSTLDRLKVPRDGLSLVLNKAESDVGLSPADVQEVFDHDFSGVLPYAKEVSRSFNNGRPVLEVGRGSAIGKALLSTIEGLTGLEPARAAASPAAALGPISRLLRRAAA